MKKRLICLVLAAVMLLGLLPVAAAETTAGTEELLFRHVWEDNGSLVLGNDLMRLADENDLVPGNSRDMILYYGTEEYYKDLIVAER